MQARKGLIVTIGFLQAFLPFAGATQAEEVLLDISVAVGAAQPRQSRITAVFGKETTIPAGNAFRVTLLPTLIDADRVRIQTTIYDATSNETIAVPTVESQAGEPATMSWAKALPSEYLEIKVTPYRF